MHRLFALLVLCFTWFLAAPARAAEVEFLRVWPGWRDAESFVRISEYFSGRENPGREVIVRTQRTERAGYYFLVRVKSALALDRARFELQVIRPDAPEPKTFSFPVTLPAKETVFQLGVTGTDWPQGSEASPVAWKLSLLAPDGRLLTEHESFLWEKPKR